MTEGPGASHPVLVEPPDRLRRLRGIATLLDSAVRVPGTRVRFGLDALIGLVPGVGDVAGGMASAWVLIEAARLGASRPVLLRMLGNVVVEVLVGAVPLLGDLFDVGWRANVRNVDLLERHLGTRAVAGRTPRQVGLLFVGGLLTILFTSVALVLWLLVLAVQAF